MICPRRHHRMKKSNSLIPGTLYLIHESVRIIDNNAEFPTNYYITLAVYYGDGRWREVSGLKPVKNGYSYNCYGIEFQTDELVDLPGFYGEENDRLVQLKHDILAYFPFPNPASFIPY